MTTRSGSKRHGKPRAMLGLLVLLTAGSLAQPSKAADWPQFRGPLVDATSVESGIFPSGRAFGLELHWRRPLGSGYAGVSVAGSTLAVAYSEGENDMVAALEEATGKTRWTFVLDKTYEGHDGSHTGPIATPLLYENKVIVLAPRGRVVALDEKNGSLVWDMNVVEDLGATKPHYGFTASPIVVGGTLLLQLGSPVGALAGFDPETGKLLWKGGEDIAAYQTPVPAQLHDRHQVLVTGMAKIFGFDSGTGDVLWEHPHGGNGPRGAMSLVPVPAGGSRVFLAHQDNASTTVRLNLKDGKSELESLWENREIRNSYNVPVYHEDHIYAFSSRFLTCVHAETGESKWRSRQPGDGFLILVDGHLVIATKSGSLHIAPATPDGYREVAHLPLFEELIWSPPSFANGRIYVRGLGDLARVDVRSGMVTRAKDKETSESRAGSGNFAAFLRKVKSASNKKKVVDEFLATVDSFPLIEGNNRAHFLYRGAAKDVAIGGDMIGARQERPMNRVEGTDLYYYSTDLAPDARLNYLFMKDYEEITDPLNPRTTVTTMVGKDMEMSFTGQEMPISWMAMPEWKEPAHLTAAPPGNPGRIETRKLKSKGLGQTHELKIYLPADYEKNEATRYPVLYVHGGDAAVKYGKFVEALDHSIGKNVAPLIAVFVAVQAPFGQTLTYAQVYEKEIVPYVDAEFRTIPEAKARGNFGAGFAGTNAAFCTLGLPGVANHLATQSAFVMESMLTPIMAILPDGKSWTGHLYVEWGKYDFRNPHEAWDLGDSNRKFAKMLKDKGYRLKGGEVSDGCDWPSWQNRIPVVLESLFPRETSSPGSGD